MSPVNVTFERQESASLNTRTMMTYATVVRQTRVDLRVFDITVDAYGVIAIASFKDARSVSLYPYNRS